MARLKNWWGAAAARRTLRPQLIGPEEYWRKRQNILYYQVVKIIVDHIGKNAMSILDVGSAGCPYLDWFKHIPKRTSIDLNTPYKSAGITSYTGDFMLWEPDQHYDLVLCLQVLEHVPDAEKFAQKLLTAGTTVVVSVPYKWPFGHKKSHVHDPVDEIKLQNGLDAIPISNTSALR